MSKIVKGIKKVFKKVVKVVKRVAPVALAAAAVFFTAGAALGVAGAAGGWSAAASTIASSFGGGTVLTGALSGAITQAGYGALIGGTLSKLRGGSFTEGAKMGAATGLLTGGVGGAVSSARTAAATAAPASATPTGGAPAATAAPAPAANVQPVTGAPAAVPGAPVNAAAAGKGGLLRGVGDWVSKNQDLVGNLVSGVGQGMMAGSEADAEFDLMRERERLRRENYGGMDPGRGFRGLAPGTSTTTPMERYDPRTYGDFEYVYDPRAGRIVRQPRS